MFYTVRPGDTLWKIAVEHCGRGEAWKDIAQDNWLRSPDRILVGDKIFIRKSLETANPLKTYRSQRELEHPLGLGPENSPSLIPGRAFLFIVAEEVNPLSEKVVRRIIVHPKVAEAASLRRGRRVPVLVNPEKFGLHPTSPESTLPMGRHAQSHKPSPYSSASRKPLGAPRMMGSRFWIDVERAKSAGATFHEVQEIVNDLDRIAAKTANAAERAKILALRDVVRGDAEVLIKGSVPATAIKGAAAMAMTKAVQGVQIVGFVMTAVDVANATEKSLQTNSPKPLIAESIRQTGGWAAAWAGVKLGALAGAAVGIETGPGAVITGLIGATIGGVAGYCAFDWVADHIDAN